MRFLDDFLETTFPDRRPQLRSSWEAQSLSRHRCRWVHCQVGLLLRKASSTSPETPRLVSFLRDSISPSLEPAPGGSADVGRDKLPLKFAFRCALGSHPPLNQRTSPPRAVHSRGAASFRGRGVTEDVARGCSVGTPGWRSSRKQVEWVPQARRAEVTTPRTPRSGGVGRRRRTRAAPRCSGGVAKTDQQSVAGPRCRPDSLQLLPLRPSVF